MKASFYQKKDGSVYIKIDGFSTALTLEQIVNLCIDTQTIKDYNERNFKSKYHIRRGVSPTEDKKESTSNVVKKDSKKKNTVPNTTVIGKTDTDRAYDNIRAGNISEALRIYMGFQFGITTDEAHKIKLTYEVMTGQIMKYISKNKIKETIEETVEIVNRVWLERKGKKITFKDIHDRLGYEEQMLIDPTI